MTPELTTAHLRLFPVTPDILRRAAHSGEMAPLLGLDTDPMTHDERKVRRAVYKYKCVLCARYPFDMVFCTAWPLVELSTGKLVGEVGFKGPPDNDGGMEIGYSTRAAFRNRGYMSEAVDALCRYAFESPPLFLKYVFATTLPDNLASHRVLSKCGFIQVGHVEELLLWHLYQR